MGSLLPYHFPAHNPLSPPQPRSVLPKLTSAGPDHRPVAIIHAKDRDADVCQGLSGWYSHWGSPGSSFHVGWFMMPKRPLPSLEPLRPLAESNELPDLGTWNQTDSMEPLLRRKGCRDALSLGWYQNSPQHFSASLHLFKQCPPSRMLPLSSHPLQVLLTPLPKPSSNKAVSHRKRLCLVAQSQVLVADCEPSVDTKQWRRIVSHQLVGLLG